MIVYGLTNLIAQQVDAFIRPGELVAQDIIAVRTSPHLRTAVVSSQSRVSSEELAAKLRI